MADIFDEVEEQLRHERYMAYFKQYGPWVLGAVTAIVLGVAGFEAYKHFNKVAAERASDQYLGALENLDAGEDEAALAALRDLATSGPSGYGILALMQNAAYALEQGNTAQAASLYREAATRSNDPIIRDMARYKSVLAEFETLSYDDAVIRLRPLTEGNATYGLLARELIGAAAMKAGRWDEARAQYDILVIQLDAPGLNQRAREALALINQNAPLPAPTPAPVETSQPASVEPASDTTHGEQTSDPLTTSTQEN
ncbi:tetratricopeptide repeat protein [Woodsholea maritima]|uniref:tetratricopeptide repeat protein n=1 Tax=Woodsholea maritima TaxID=240237 RepID=UPI00037BBD95|nr:tetratricopeptide repeat protein [Woodsholea maritima]